MGHLSSSYEASCRVGTLARRLCFFARESNRAEVLALQSMNHEDEI
jgi:hypothetical protein